MKNWKQYYNNQKQKIIQQLGGSCNGCGSTTNLQFHHPYRPKGYYKKHTRSNPWMIQKELKNNEIIQLYCHICHKIIEGQIPGISKKESFNHWYQYHQEHLKQYRKKQYAKNQEIIKHKSRQQYRRNRHANRLHSQNNI